MKGLSRTVISMLAVGRLPRSPQTSCAMGARPRDFGRRRYRCPPAELLPELLHELQSARLVRSGACGSE